jgi:serine/threonine-protein phosphatase 2A regulatory subunit B
MEYRNGHQFHIHSVSASSDGENFISGDEVGINLWNINSNNVGYNLVNIAPPKMDDLLEVLTHCEFHPEDPMVYLYSSSRGYFSVADLRSQSAHVKYDCTDEETHENTFSEIIQSVSHASFTKDGSRIISRDYLHIRLWDIR